MIIFNRPLPLARRNNKIIIMRKWRGLKVCYKPPSAVYAAWCNNCRARGIACNLTLDQWWALWAPHWPRRLLDDLCLCRTADTGAYSLGNVRIDTRAANNIESIKYRPAR